MKIANTFNYRGVQFVESELLAELHDMCYQCNGGFNSQRAEIIAEKLSDAELEQAYWTIGNKGVDRVCRDEIKHRNLKLDFNLECYLMSKLEGAANQEYFEKYVCGI